MWHRAWRSSIWNLRRFCTATRRRIIDEGDWIYSSEWWGTQSDGHTVLRSTSDNGNGVVSVVAYPSSRPSKNWWPEMERWLQQRYIELHPGCGVSERFRVLGYQWRSLRFNDDTRQSTVKIMAACRESEPGSVFFMQQPDCLAVPYLKSMVSVGLATMASCYHDPMNAVHRQKSMKILCIGHGGGSLPLFLASKIQGAVVDVVEIDPVVISASVQAMGFPSFSVMTPSGERCLSQILIPSTQYSGKASMRGFTSTKLMLRSLSLRTIICMIWSSLMLMTGDDIFPRKLWDPDSPFVKALSSQLHPEHGTVVVNLHSDSAILDPRKPDSYFHQQLPSMGKYVSTICRAYKDVLVGNRSSRDGKTGSGLGFVVSVPCLYNSTLVVSRGFGVGGGHYHNRDSILNTLISKSLEVELALNLPFPCLKYIKSGFTLSD
ncbi:hypothetical protein Dsin_027245 [Dipteronia sinensis]|uniref:S-adenosyl-L-methionine-dependent methyltransferase superfamily protein n=1 Tax=Dipteronia sinensis TaxID=43782 RepID=A0AAD9ZNJ6_9ROSI|nr:hypothetical protein Dsin_027245 [Dipteronia sinensis]